MQSQSHLPGGSVSLPEVQEDRGAQEGVLPAEDSPVRASLPICIFWKDGKTTGR